MKLYRESFVALFGCAFICCGVATPAHSDFSVLPATPATPDTNPGMAPASISQPRSLTVEAKAGPYAGRTFYSNSHALLVGIK